MKIFIFLLCLLVGAWEIAALAIPGLPRSRAEGLIPGIPANKVVVPGFPSNKVVEPGFPSNKVVEPGFPATKVLEPGTPAKEGVEPGIPAGVGQEIGVPATKGEEIAASPEQAYVLQGGAAPAEVYVIKGLGLGNLASPQGSLYPGYPGSIDPGFCPGCKFPVPLGGNLASPSRILYPGYPGKFDLELCPGCSFPFPFRRAPNVLSGNAPVVQASGGSFQYYGCKNSPSACDRRCKGKGFSRGTCAGPDPRGKCMCY